MIAFASDHSLQQKQMGDLEALVRQRTAGRISQLKVTCRQGEFILEGQSPSFYVKQLAQQALMEVVGLSICNVIEVVAPPSCA